MDIPVSRLNRRMALQVPPELPLGLVFIVGNVHNLQAAESQDRRLHVQLRDDEHVLDCRVPRQIVDETLLSEGDRVRLGGQLLFDAQSARYQLFAHHIEVLASAADRKAAGPSPVSGRRVDSNEAGLSPPKLPDWVSKLAPPEIRKELGFADEMEGTGAADPSAHGRQAGAGTAAPSESIAEASGDDFIADLPPEMIRFLSQAIDSEEDVELTPEMLAAFGSTAKPAAAPERSKPFEERGASALSKPAAVEGRATEMEQMAGDGSFVDSIATWLGDPQLYLVPLLMILVFICAVFLFVLFQH